MTERTFEQAFNAVFHDKNLLNDFFSLDMEQEVSTFQIGDRSVFKTSDKLKSYLRFIDRVILRNLAKEEDIIHSFIKGKSPLTAVTPHSVNKYFFLTDISKFYESIKTENVRNILDRDKKIIPISDIEHHIDYLTEIMTYTGNIPVGFSTSPQISNAFLFEFDQKLNKFCEHNRLTYTRYADDLIISARSFNELSELTSNVQALLTEFASPEMKLNKAKTRITNIGNKVKILGLIITPAGQITIDSKHKKNIETLLHFFANDKNKYNDLLHRKFKGDEKSIFGLLHYASSIDPKYIDKLQRKYGIYTLRSLMEDKASDR